MSEIERKIENKYTWGLHHLVFLQIQPEIFTTT